VPLDVIGARSGNMRALGSLSLECSTCNARDVALAVGPSSTSSFSFVGVDGPILPRKNHEDSIRTYKVRIPMPAQRFSRFAHVAIRAEMAPAAARSALPYSSPAYSSS
jgi:hypothetical protein